jgi:hypothetical protein
MISVVETKGQVLDHSIVIKQLISYAQESPVLILIAMINSTARPVTAFFATMIMIALTCSAAKRKVCQTTNVLSRMSTQQVPLAISSAGFLEPTQTSSTVMMISIA